MSESWLPMDSELNRKDNCSSRRNGRAGYNSYHQSSPETTVAIVHGRYPRPRCMKLRGEGRIDSAEIVEPVRQLAAIRCATIKTFKPGQPRAAKFQRMQFFLRAPLNGLRQHAHQQVGVVFQSLIIDQQHPEDSVVRILALEHAVGS